MTYYPMFVQMKDRSVLVVGGGAVAERKVEALLGFGARVTVLSKELTVTLEKWVREGRVMYRGTDFSEEALEGVSVVFAATNDTELNHRISMAASRRGLLVNAVDQPADCSFIVPAMVRRGDLTIAVSTGGKSPALAKKIRRQLEQQFGDAHSEALSLLGKVRTALLPLGLPQEENRRLFERIIDAGLLEALGRGATADVTEILRTVLPRELCMENLVPPSTCGTKRCAP